MKEFGEEEFQNQFKELKDKIENSSSSEHTKFMMNIYEVGGDL